MAYIVARILFMKSYQFNFKLNVYDKIPKSAVLSLISEYKFFIYYIWSFSERLSIAWESHLTSYEFLKWKQQDRAFNLPG